MDCGCWQWLRPRPARLPLLGELEAFLISAEGDLVATCCDPTSLARLSGCSKRLARSICVPVDLRSPFPWFSKVFKAFEPEIHMKSTIDID